MEKKYLGGRLDRNTTFGLLWLLTFVGFGWIFAIILLVMDKETLSLEDKREVVSSIVLVVLAWLLVIPSFVIVGLFGIGYLVVCNIIACIKAFQGSTFQIPGVYQISKLFIK